MCHTGPAPVAKSGSMHQAAYKELYQDGVIKVSDMAFSAAGDTATLTFKMTKNGASFDCTKPVYSASNPGGKFTIASNWVAYDSATRKFSFMPLFSGFNVTLGTKAYDAATNTCTLKKAGLTPEQVTGMNGNGIATLYGTDEIVSTDDAAHLITGKYPFGGVLKVGTVDYTSAANVSGCENCHTVPFLKHTYIYGQVDVGGGTKGLDFYTCKGCHDDNAAGGHVAWQIKKDGEVNGDLSRWADIYVNGAPTTAAEEAKYAYKKRLMNDVHMSHAMEFAYPQSMKNCVTCHAGKLDVALADDKFQAATCKSCHSVDGLRKIMSEAAFSHSSMLDNPDATNCGGCHSSGAAVAPTFKTIHNGGFDPKIYSAAGDRYADKFVVQIDSASVASNKLTIKFSATGSLGSLSAANITPTVLVGLYGYDSKDFLVAAHGTNADGKRNLEYVWDGTATNNPTSRFTQVGKTTAGGATTWELQADLSLWADKITAGDVRRAEIAVMPELKDGAGVVLGLNAPSRTFDLTANAFNDAYFKDIVKINAGCNTCHDQLATTFHSGNRGGNIKVCRICHEVSNPGAHLELQSRSIDSYVHAIHAFQILDRQNYDLTQLVDKAEYLEHIGQQFPRFGNDCESCHVAGMFDVPNQGMSMPGVLQSTNTVKDVRNLGPLPPSVTGPAVRACGACHRSELIKADDPTNLAVLNSHFKTFGYVVDTTASESRALWESIVAKMMALFD